MVATVTGSWSSFQKKTWIRLKLLWLPPLVCQTILAPLQTSERQQSKWTIWEYGAPVNPFTPVTPWAMTMPQHVKVWFTRFIYDHDNMHYVRHFFIFHRLTCKALRQLFYFSVLPYLLNWISKSLRFCLSAPEDVPAMKNLDSLFAMKV